MMVAAEYHEGSELLGPTRPGWKGRKQRRPRHNLALGLQDVETKTQRFLVRIPMTVNSRGEATLAPSKILC